MKVVQIPKKDGRFRTIYVPDREEKRQLRLLLGDLRRKAERLCDPSVVHGFMRGKSPVTNALAHVGHQYTVTLDLEDFFDSVTEEKLRGKLSKEQLELVLVDGAARQGLPTSPLVANIAACDMDKAILKWIRQSGKDVVYTRYADDLAFSFDDPELVPVVITKVTEIVRRCGFRVNPAKVRVQWAGAGRRVICGVAVDDHGIYPTREVKRKLRAALHQGNIDSARGLEEWCKLKPPNPRRAQAKMEAEGIEGLRKLWKLRKIDIEGALTKKVQQDRNLGDDCYITNDPAYFFGMSTFTTGWTSCMRQPDGQYAKGVVTWLMLPGTSVAVFLSKHTMTIGNVERRKMRARCLVHQLRDGTLVYDRLYGNPDDTPVLARKLEEAGYIPIRKAPSGVYVVGNVPANLPMPYCDNLKKETVRLKNGKEAVRFHT